ncbi:glycine-rich cell wall structural protein-like [Selaginella moellendorffii]|uniref:glycine-rich cell wall structural protein-like n=1 Tax=Selaginella moellendorffii TaxID=88036 RepID=UPI000D1C75C7|nr:glycine-rich cell wall structural protein-like [Selaginella moellendorffii]|eukprot:XP_024523200.1 glycine-rich cell wall structural protein-like [Selaginella moellendorffii]
MEGGGHGVVGGSGVAGVGRGSLNLAPGGLGHGSEAARGGGAPGGGGHGSTLGGSSSGGGGHVSSPGGGQASVGGAEATAGGVQAAPGGAQATSGGVPLEHSVPGVPTALRTRDGSEFTFLRLHACMSD